LRAAVVYVEPLFRAAGLVDEVAPKMSVVAIAQKGCQAEAWRYMGQHIPAANGVRHAPQDFSVLCPYRAALMRVAVMNFTNHRSRITNQSLTGAS
jgi:hypothetical protein